MLILAGLERAINHKIVEKLEEIRLSNEVIYLLLKDALWQEYLNRNKQRWSYSQWYLKLIEKYAQELDE